MKIYGISTKLTTFNTWSNYIKQYAWFIHHLLISSLFQSSWNTKKGIIVEWLKWNRIKLTSMLPIFVLSLQSAEQSYYKVDLLKHSKSKMRFYSEIPCIKTFLTWKQVCIVMWGICLIENTRWWNLNTLKNTQVFQTNCILFVSANEKICDDDDDDDDDDDELFLRNG